MQRRSPAEFLRQVERTIGRHQMLAAGDRVLVALSGGPDSVALLAALHALAGRFRITLRAAHLNHGLRGAEAGRDQAAAARLAARLGIVCDVGHAALRVGRTGNVEERARAARYQFLIETARARECTRIATGHTLDDQAETVLLRLLRGAGTDGLAGIPPVRDGWIIRPLLERSRAEVLAFLEAEGLPYCVDSSNADARLLRNRVRHELLPVLRGFQPAIVRRLAAAAQAAGVEREWLDAQARAAAAPAADGTLSVDRLCTAPAALQGRIVRCWLQTCRGHVRGITAAHVAAVLAVCRGHRPNARTALPGGEAVVREYARLCWSAGERVAPDQAPRLLFPGTTVRFECGWQIRAEAVQPAGAPEWKPASLWVLMADAQALPAPPVVRLPRPGDRVRPLGMHGHRKLQDLFVDRKVPAAARRVNPVVECAGEILWVPGIVRSPLALVTATTHTALRLVAERSGTGIAGAWGLC